MRNFFCITLIILFFGFTSVAFSSDEPAHNDKEHEQAEKNLDHPHWEKAHGSGVPDKPERKPGFEKPEHSESGD